MATPQTLSVKILDKDYLVACPPDAQDELRKAAKQLDMKMREIRASGKVYGTERIAVMAALNLTYDVMQQDHLSSHVTTTLNQIGDKIEQELARTV
ncbi:MAG: cell division protein ZapA [Hahellaceae bacterium]|nr:cell division protein ZapA [Hahellaceae bacterium]